jgi:hypothetical protein
VWVRVVVKVVVENMFEHVEGWTKGVYNAKSDMAVPGVGLGLRWKVFVTTRRDEGEQTGDVERKWERSRAVSPTKILREQ